MTESMIVHFNHGLVVFSCRACSCQILSNLGGEGTCEPCNDSKYHITEEMQRESNEAQSASQVLLPSDLVGHLKSHLWTSSGYITGWLVLVLETEPQASVPAVHLRYWQAEGEDGFYLSISAQQICVREVSEGERETE